MFSTPSSTVAFTPTGTRPLTHVIFFASSRLNPEMPLSRTDQVVTGSTSPTPTQALRKVELGTVMVDSLELCRMKGDEQTGGAPWAESPGVDPNAPSIKLNAWGGNDEILVWHW